MMALTMGGISRRSGGDPYYGNVSSLLRFNGGDASTTFTDEKGISWTAVGTAAIDTGVTQFGESTGQVTGGTGRITASANQAFNLSTTIWTIDGWIYCTAAGGCPLLNDQATTNKALALYMDSGVSGRVLKNNSNIISSITLPGLSTWFHFALTSNGSSMIAWVNGALAGSAAANTFGGNDAVSQIGSATHTAWRGSVKDLRITKGVCRWNNAFTPPYFSARDH